MVDYKCNTCEKTFKQKIDYTRHQKRKNPCIQKVSSSIQKVSSKKVQEDPKIPEPSIQVVSSQDKKHSIKSMKCPYCENNFTQKNNLYRHVKLRCPVRKEQERLQEEAVKKLASEKDHILKKLQEEIEELKKRPVKVTNISNVGNTVGNTVKNTINNNVAIVDCGKEDIKKLDKEKIADALRRGFFSTKFLIDETHFNPDHPEYHNVYISNIKDKYGFIHEGEWKIMMKDDIIDKVFTNKKVFISMNMGEYKEYLTTSQANALRRFLDTDESHKKITEVKEEIKMLLYNKRNIPMKMRKDLEIENSIS